MSDTPKITVTVQVTIDRGTGEASTVTETVVRTPSVLPLTATRECDDARRGIDVAATTVLDRILTPRSVYGAIAQPPRGRQ